MAELTSGPFLSIVKSVGGLTFYRMDGRQYVRSKPVVPEGFVPSVNQLLAEAIFGKLSERISRLPLLDQLQELNYSVVGKYAAMTARDLLLGQVYHYLLYTPDGRPYSYEAREYIFSMMDEYLSMWISAFGPISFQNAIPYPPYVTEIDAEMSTTISITDNGWRYWKLQLAEIGYHVAKDTDPIVIEIRQSKNISPTGPWDVRTMSHSMQKYQATVSDSQIVVYDGAYTEALSVRQFALAARLDPEFYEGLTDLWVAAPARRVVQMIKG